MNEGYINDKIKPYYDKIYKLKDFIKFGNKILNIIFKFIPAAYIIMKNKITVVYENSLSDLNQYIIKYSENTKEKLEWKTFTSDFVKALINGFHKTFNKKMKKKFIM